MTTTTMRLLVGIAWAALGLGACSTPPPRPELHPTQVVPAAPDIVLRRAGAILPELGLNLIELDRDVGRLRAQRPDVDETVWAQCPAAIAFDPDGQRRRRAEERGLDVELVLSTTPRQDGSAVTLRPRFERTYLNSFTNLEFARRCRSTGELERAIFERLQPPPPVTPG